MLRQKNTEIKDSPLSERELAEIQKKPDALLCAENNPIEKQVTNKAEAKKILSESLEHTYSEKWHNNEKTKPLTKNESSVQKKMNIFSVELALNGDIEITKKPRPSRSRKNGRRYGNNLENTGKSS